MPTYDYKCEECEYEFEEMLLISKRDEPTKEPCKECGGEIKQVMYAPYFGYDNIKTRHSQNNKEPSWFKERMSEIKKSKRVPNNTMP